MKRRCGVLWKVSGLAIVAHAGCSIEQHPLSYGALSSSASQAGTGSTSTGDTAGAGDSAGTGGTVGESGAPAHDGGAQNVGSTGMNSAGSMSAPSGGTSAGSGGTTAGSSGTNAAGNTSAGGGSGGTSVGGSDRGGTGNAGSAGSVAGGGGSGGGVPDAGPCGDADRNGVQDCQETLAKNATFDHDINGWSPDFNVTQTWISDDAWKQPNSGSLSLTFTTQAGGQGWAGAAVSQCLPGWSGQQFEIGAHAFIADGQEGSAQVSFAMFGSDGCAGSFLGTTTPAVAATTGSWQSLHASVTLEPGTRSVLVRLGAAKPSTQTSLEIHFDDVLVRMK